MEKNSDDVDADLGLAEEKLVSHTDKNYVHDKVSGMVDFSTFNVGPSARIEKLLASGVMELADSGRSILNLVPCTQMELYHRALLGGKDASIHQKSISRHDDLRDNEMNTEGPEMLDKEMQFTYGDDTDLINAMNAIATRKQQLSEGKTPEGSLMEQLREMNLDTSPSSSSAIDNALDALSDLDKTPSTSTSSGGDRLGTFLQRASTVCEMLLDEEDREARREADRNSGAVPGSTFFDSRQSDQGWRALGTNTKSGANELIRARTCSAIAFSALQPHQVMTAHPSPTSADALEDDLRPHKALFCVWDVSSPEEPLWVLEGMGDPTSCCFSASETNILVAGMSDGSLHMFDLREANSLHRDKDSVDLGIKRGIRKPSFSSQRGGFLSMLEEAAKDKLEVHQAPIAQIEPIGGGVSTISQFASLDESGLVCMWVIAAPRASALPNSEKPLKPEDADLETAPWSSVRLDLSRSLFLNADIPLAQSRLMGHPTGFLINGNESENNSRNRFSTSNSEKNGKGSKNSKSIKRSSSSSSSSTVSQDIARLCTSWPMEVSTFATIPNEPSSMYISGSRGRVSKIARFGAVGAEAERGTALLQPLTARVRLDEKHWSSKDVLGGLKEVTGHSTATCISVGPVLNAPKIDSKLKFLNDSDDEDENKHISKSKSTTVESNSESKGDVEASSAINEKGEPEFKDPSMKKDNAKKAMRPEDMGTIRVNMILVGRKDGTVDLYRSDRQRPMASWDLSGLGYVGDSLVPSNKDELFSYLDNTTVLVQWLPGRASAFIAVDKKGRAHIFDLIRNTDEPTLTERLSGSRDSNDYRGDKKTGHWEPMSVKLSSCLPGGSTFHLAASATGSCVADGLLSVQKLDPGLLEVTEGGNAEAEGLAVLKNFNEKAWSGVPTSRAWVT
jgi:hypothetical protein